MTRKFSPKLNKRHAKTVGDYEFYTVDPFAIRNAAQSDEEFGNFATHDELAALIPEGQVWVAEKLWRREGQFLIADAVARLDARARGRSEEQAYDAGLRAERKLRAEVTGIRLAGRKAGRTAERAARPAAGQAAGGRAARRAAERATGGRVGRSAPGAAKQRGPAKLYVRRYGRLTDPKGAVAVWRIDGHLVRCMYKTDYTEGGHGYVYPWIPKDEIWIDASIVAAEIPYLVAHEYTELRLMRDDGIPYDRAHEIAARVEFDLRRPKQRQALPGLGRGSFTSASLRSVASAAFQEHVKKHYANNPLRRLGEMLTELKSKIWP